MKFDAEHRRKLSEARLRGLAEGRITHPRGMLGKKHSIETRGKISVNHKFKKEEHRKHHSEMMQIAYGPNGHAIRTSDKKRWTPERKIQFKATMIALFDKRGRKTTLNKVLRGRQEVALWRVSVFERDSWTCRECKAHGVYLEAHHIKSWAKYPDLRYNIENGLTLCKPCHKLTDNYAGKNK